MRSIGRILSVVAGLLFIAAVTLAGIGAWVNSPKPVMLTTESETTIPFLAPVSPPLLNVNPTPAPLVEKVPVLELRAANTLVLRGPVTALSMAKLQEEILQKSEQLSKSDTIYLTLDTPGGDIDAGNSFIDMAKALPQKVKTVTLFAASMGFHIAQNLDERLIVPSGTLMSHRAKVGGVGGEIPGELITRINFLLKMLTDMESIASARMKMPLAQYQDLIKDEYWVTGRNSVAEKVADRMVLARCGKDLMGTYEEKVQVFIFQVSVVFSKCPIIQGPLKVDFSNIKFETERQKLEAQEYLDELFFHKKEFVKKRIVPMLN